VSYNIHASIGEISLLLTLIFGVAHLVAADSGAAAPAIVIGFVGGMVKHDDMVHSVVQVAAELRQHYPGVHVEVFENRRREEALAEIFRLLNHNGNGKLSADEKKNARIILYGHSWGASAAITLARELDRDGIPVLLTVQVDSVPRAGENDRVIPANVAEAVNFYELNGFLHGEPQIRPADPKRTHILGDFQFDYKGNPIDCKHYPWYDRLLMRPHIEIECDPKVWTQVESLIESKLLLQRD
jgi:hypothetical protein